MSRFTDDIKKFIVEEGLIADGDIVLTGVSGGADSVCLFHVLYELRQELHFDLAVVHINHMIREAAASEAEFVEGLCEERGIRFFRRDIDIPSITDGADLSEEEAGRNERYRAFCSIAGDLVKETGRSVKIATAHNLGDQAETVLHNLFRGSRLKGLLGIRSKGIRDGFALIRPLIRTDRPQIEEYLSENGFEHCNDSSNFTDDYTRNRIRHNIIPVAKEQINQRADRHIAEAAEYLGRIDDFIEDEADKVRGWILEENEEAIILDCRVLAGTADIIRERLIAKAINRLYPHIKDIQAVHIRELSGMTLETEGSSMLNMPYGIKAVRTYDRLRLFFEKDTETESTCFPVDLQELEGKEHMELEIPGLGTVSLCVFPYKSDLKIPTGEYTKWLNYDKINNSLQFRTRSVGDTICVGNGNKKLKKFMIDEKIPIDRRDRLFILADGNCVMWVPGYRIGDDYKLGDDSGRVLEVSITNI